MYRKINNIQRQRTFCTLFMTNKHKPSFSWLPSAKQRRSGMKRFCSLLDYKENETSREIEESSSFSLDFKCKEFWAAT